MGKAQSSFIRVEHFAAIIWLLALYCTFHHMTQPASLALLYRGTGNMSFYVMLLILRWRVGSPLKEDALLFAARCY